MFYFTNQELFKKFIIDQSQAMAQLKILQN